MNRSRHGRPTLRHRLLARWPLLALVWGLGTAAGLVVAAKTSVGPVVLSLSQSHGIHLGDLVAFSFFYGVALLITALAV